MAANEFEKSLLKIESPLPALRQEGVLDLKKINDSRALQVLLALEFDPDPLVKRFAAAGVSQLEAAGVRLKRPQTDRRCEIETIGSPLEVVDEVFFLFRRNAPNIMYLAISSGSLKILLGLLFLFSPQMVSSVQFLQSGFFSAAPVLFFIQQVFFRPIAWLTVGRAFLAGYPDPAARQQARIPLSLSGYFGFLPANLIQAIPLCLAFLFLAFLPRPMVDNLVGPKFICLMLVAWYLYASFALLPMQLSNVGHGSEAIGKAIRIYWERGSAVRSFFPTFLLYYGALMAIIYINFQLLLGTSFPFVEAQTAGILLLADSILDPFWIGFRILVTRLLEGKAECKS